jgi:hypothetical protein
LQTQEHEGNHKCLEISEKKKILNSTRERRYLTCKERKERMTSSFLPGKDGGQKMKAQCKIKQYRSDAVAHSCNPRYLGGTDGEDGSARSPTQAKT